MLICGICLIPVALVDKLIKVNNSDASLRLKWVTTASLDWNFNLNFYVLERGHRDVVIVMLYRQIQEQI